jgi:hypothetical protein
MTTANELLARYDNDPLDVTKGELAGALWEVLDLAAKRLDDVVALRARQESETLADEPQASGRLATQPQPDVRDAIATIADAWEYLLSELSETVRDGYASQLADVAAAIDDAVAGSVTPTEGTPADRRRAATERSLAGMDAIQRAEAVAGAAIPTWERIGPNGVERWEEDRGQWEGR